MAMRAMHIFVRGRVQGVGYRAFVEREAERLQLSGWVRNQHDGSVEVVVSGEETAVDAMIASCRRGPSGALVSDVTTKFYDGPELAGFSVVKTN